MAVRLAAEGAAVVVSDARVDGCGERGGLAAAAGQIEAPGMAEGPKPRAGRSRLRRAAWPAR